MCFLCYLERSSIVPWDKEWESKGAESTPFEPPSQWDLKSLLIMIKDHVQLTVDKDISIDKLYLKKHGRSKALVVVNGDLDVTSMLREYPGFQRMYMAVDWHIRLLVSFYMYTVNYAKCWVAMCQNTLYFTLLLCLALYDFLVKESLKMCSKKASLNKFLRLFIWTPTFSQTCC